jgi:hypothetical protein
MRSSIYLCLGILMCIISQVCLAGLVAGSYPIEDFENIVASKETANKPNVAKPAVESSEAERYHVTTDRGCNLSFTTKEFVVSGKSAAKFAVTTSDINPYRPAFFSFKTPVTDWTRYNTLNFYLFVLPATQYPEATILIQLHSTDFDGTSWQDTNQIRSYVFKAPVGRPLQVMLSLRNIPFKQKIGEILFSVVNGTGTYYLDNMEIYPTTLQPEIELFPPYYYPNKNVMIPDWMSIYFSQMPMQSSGVDSRNGFYDHGTFMYDGRNMVLLCFQNSKPFKKKDTIKVTISDDTGYIFKRTTLTFDKSDMRKSIPLRLNGDQNLAVEYNKQNMQVKLKDLSLLSQENASFRAARKQTGNPFHRGIISAYAGMLYTPDGNVDVDKTLDRLQDLGVNGYTYLIWQKSEAELKALPEFCEKAAAAGIEVWAYLVPPSEAPVGKRAGIAEKKYPPFDMDYLKWAEAIAKISVAHPNLTLWMIDDFDGNLNYFTVEYVKKMYELSKQINPKLLVGYCVYHDRLKKYVDAGYMPYTDALLWGYQDGYWLYPDAGVSPATLPAEINDYYKACGDKPIIPCIYFTRHTSWPNDRPTLRYLAQAMDIAYEQAGIVWVYTTPSPDSPKYDLVKKYIQSIQLPKWTGK